jgi:hypothetical protein
MDNLEKNTALWYALGFGAFGLLILVLLFMMLFANTMATKKRPEIEPPPAASPNVTP